MALLFCDGFDSYSSTADLLKKWGGNNGWTYNATAGRNGGGAVQVTSAVILSTPFAITPALSEQAYGFWLKVSALPGAAATILYPLNSGAGAGAQLRLQTTGFLGTANSAGTVLQGGFTQVADNKWHWIEWHIESAGGTNSTATDLYVDTLLQFSVVNSSAGNVLITDHFQLGGVAGVTTTIDDIIFWNNLSPAPLYPTNFPLGPREITTLRPDADNTQTFARSAGAANYSLVNEQTQDGDTTYVESGTSGDQDLYEYGSFATNPANITSVMLNNVLQNPNAGTINFQGACKSNATTTLGTSTITPSTGYFTKQNAYAVDPNTAAAWTGANLANAKFGIKVA